jgi:hypothetical protein
LGKHHRQTLERFILLSALSSLTDMPVHQGHV